MFDFEGGLVAGLGPLAFIGELELRPGGLFLEVDFIGSDGGMPERACSRSLKNRGKNGFFGDLVLSLEKFISHAKPSWLDSPSSLVLLPASAVGGAAAPCSKSTVKERLDIAQQLEHAVL